MLILDGESERRAAQDVGAVDVEVVAARREEAAHGRDVAHLDGAQELLLLLLRLQSDRHEKREERDAFDPRALKHQTKTKKTRGTD